MCADKYDLKSADEITKRQQRKAAICECRAQRLACGRLTNVARSLRLRQLACLAEFGEIPTERSDGGGDERESDQRE